MSFVINDEDFCRDGFISPEIERVFVRRFFLTVCDVLGMVLGCEFENLKIILFGFHAVDAVPEYYLSDERNGACYASCDITLIVEHTSSPLPATKKSPKLLHFGENSVCRYKRIADIIATCR